MRSMFLALLAAATLVAGAPPPTLRVDYYHTGNARTETFSLDRVVREPLPWPGNPARTVDDSNLGKYRFQVTDAASGKLLYSRGFCSIYGEWETTEEASKASRTFSESLRFPCPPGPVEILLEKRDARNAWTRIWTLSLDPSDKFVDPALPPSPGALIALERHGDSPDKVDLLLLGDGYTAAQRGKFEADARRMLAELFAHSPFRERRQDFNVWGLCPPARESGISRPSLGQYRRSPLGTTYDAFDSERYVLTFENRAFRDIASFAPYEFVEILVNGETYGGGGIFGLYSTVAADNAAAPYIFVHEFGHHIAGLADEYYTSDVAYQSSAARPEPWEPNATADPRNPKWKALLSPGAPLPTPWKKAEFEAYSHGIQRERRALRAEHKPESAMDALFAREKVFETKLLGQDAWSGQVGAFEGANYEATGYYRSQTDCIMFTRDDVPFCAACRAGISRVIDLYSRK
jgi:hypothetical protein